MKRGLFYCVCLLLCSVVLAGAAAPAVVNKPAFKVTTEEVRNITQPEDGYSGWGTIGLMNDGTLAAVYSGGRQGHVDPFGQVRMNRSTDGGITWEKFQTLHNSTIDDRDAGFLKTKDGTILVTWFTSMAWQKSLDKARQRPPEDPNSWNAAKLAAWEAVSKKATPDVVDKEFNLWLIRSEDDGKTWSDPIKTVAGSPHGPTNLADGSILYVGEDISKDGRILASISKDDGLTWKQIGEIPAREGDTRGLHEPHAIQANDGTIIVHIRNHNEANKNETLQSESKDGGKTWTKPRPIGVLGHPAHLLKMDDGRLLTTYGNRKEPFAIEASISTDNGVTWSEKQVISDSPTNWDMGYPSTVQLKDGTFVTIWYENENDSGKTLIKSVRWKIH